MKVLKFGGTSVQNAENIRKSAQIIKQAQSQTPVLTVVSALGGVTNMLIDAAKTAASGDTGYKQKLTAIAQRNIDTISAFIAAPADQAELQRLEAILAELGNLLEGTYLLREITARASDAIQSMGERMSSVIVALALRGMGVPALALDARTVVVTDGNYGKAAVDFDATNAKIAACVAENKGKVLVATGFIGASAEGETTTLGRGGSDYSGAIFAAAIKADVLEIWTDVDGMMTADPRKVKKAMLIPRISYSEAMELSHFGAKVLEPRTVLPAMAQKIPVLIKNTFNPSCEGTLIVERNADQRLQLRGVTSIGGICLLTLQGSGLIGQPGISHRLFRAISGQNINVLLITQGSSEHSITFAVSPADAPAAQKAIAAEFALEQKLGLIEDLAVEDNLSVIAAVGENMKSMTGVSGKLFDSLGKSGINVVAIAQGASELNISVVISSKDEIKALNAVHEEFFLDDVRTINVFVVGTGTIGGMLIKQIHTQRATLVAKNRVDVKVVGIMNAEGALINEDGIDLSNWEAAVTAAGTRPLAEFISQIKDLNLRNSVFVDNTASYDVASNYEELLLASVSVVTPNKVANASTYERYARLHQIANSRGARFYYETNVGAGLPIISTLKDLINSGDEILKIEAILSGSLNFIFSNLSSKKGFFECVKEARAKGYTEPDPKIDLSGMDVARKILILSREIGLKINIEDVAVENCLSPASQQTTNIDELWKTLEQYDDASYAQRVAQIEPAGKRLKYIASYENGKAQTAVREIGSDHPFYNILGSDNIIAFTTARYKTNPLIVIGEEQEQK